MSFQPNFFWVNTGWGAALFVAVTTTEVAGGLVWFRTTTELVEADFAWLETETRCTWLVLPAGGKLVERTLGAPLLERKRYATKAPASATFRPRNKYNKFRS